MDQELKELQELSQQVEQAWQSLDLNELLKQQSAVEAAMAQADFWSDVGRAQAASKQHAKLKNRTGPWVFLRQGVNDLLELAETLDESLNLDIQTQKAELKNQFETLKNELKFGGPYDDHDVIINIYAGAGGTDAQDWAGMLQRMYLRWAEQNKCDTAVIEESPGDEAGIKSATLELSGQLLYGKLKLEHGVHRLVRLSPFNSDNLRQTSFAKVDILPKVEQANEVEIDEKDLRIDVYRAGGHGGQSVNTTDSAVRITHVPTGITVAIQNERSQLQNRETAMTILRSRLAIAQLEQHQEKISELKGPNQSAEWGNQIRSYVLHPYKQVKDLRSRYETSDVEKVLDGNLNELLNANLEHNLANN